MTAELFLGSLTILTLAAIIIVTLTASDRISRPNNSNPDDGRTGRQRRSESDR